MDVASQMAKDWQNGYPGGTEEPGNRNDESWSPTYRSTCDVDSQPAEPAKTVYGAQCGQTSHLLSHGNLDCLFSLFRIGAPKQRTSLLYSN